jgi:two-component system chemotaxis response regulator CheB
VVRRILTDAINSDPDFVIVAAAKNGRDAMEKIAQLNPEIVVLDVEMPEMDGLETLSAIRAKSATLPVVMFSTLTERGAQTTIDALCRGASDYATKPTQLGSAEAALKHVREMLLPKMRALLSGGAPTRPFAAAAVRAARAPVAAKPIVATSGAVAPARVSRPRPGPIELVAIGVSTGGPNALAELMPCLPAGFPTPIVIVQHMPPLFTKLLADRLDGKSPLRVREGVAGAVLAPGEVHIAPGDHHMLIERSGDVATLALNQGTPENSCRPAVDPLFRSCAQHFGGRVLAIVLTGMGQDGLRGCEQLHAAGAQILAQDRATSVVWGMPGYVANAGLADAVLPLGSIAEEIVRRVGLHRVGARS